MKNSFRWVMSLSLAIVGIVIAAFFLLGDDPSPEGMAFQPPQPSPLVTTPVPTQTPIPLIGTEATRMQMINFNRELVTLRDTSGKIMIANFWATWCVPCRTEMPMLAQFAKDNEDTITVTAITDPEDGQTLDAVRDFWFEYAEGRLRIGLDEGGAMAEYFLVETLPTTYIIDGSGIIRFRHTGELTEDDLTNYVNSLTGIPHEHSSE